jgi:hypothetical protein
VLAVSASGESRAAPNSFTRSGPLPHSRSGLSPLAATPQKPLRADEPVNQNGELDTLRVNGVRQANSGGIETSVSRGRLPGSRVGSVRSHSVVGPHRSVLSRWLTIRSPARGPIPNHTGSGVCRSATVGLQAHKKVACVAVAGSAPVRPVAPRAGPECRVGDQTPFISSPSRQFWFCARDTALSLTPPGTAWRRTGPVCATGDRPPGPVWPPAPPAPDACPASSPDAASTPWPGANSAA